MTRPSRTVAAAVAVAATLAAGCANDPASSALPPPEAGSEVGDMTPTAASAAIPSPAPPPAPAVDLREPPTGVLHIPDGDLLAAEVARAFYDTAPVVVLAPDSRAGRLTAAATAAHLGVPVLPNDGPNGHELAAMVADLGTAVTFGTEDPRLGIDHVGLAPATEDRRRPGDDPIERPFRVEGTEVVPTLPAGEAGPALRRSIAALPPFTMDVDPPDVVLVLYVPSDVGAMLALATARAAGAKLLAVPGGDPRRSSDVIAALAGHDGPVLAIGTADVFADAAVTARRIRQARTGLELPGGGQVLFPHRLLVALYGHPGASSLGVLGEQDADAAIERAREHASWYAELVDVPVVPTLEIIATVASASPGPDGDYSRESSIEELRPWIDAAKDAGVYVVLDLQPGRTDLLTQARRYEALLLEPHVGLALDPEWRLGPGQVHLRQVGSVGIDEVNAVADWLAALTAEAQLPQKLLVVHQFLHSMIVDRHRIETSHDELAVLIQMDGQGGQASKDATYRSLTSTEPPAGVWWGWKNFYDEDHPTIRTPAETMTADPKVWFVSYQ